MQKFFFLALMDSYQYLKVKHIHRGFRHLWLLKTFKRLSWVLPENFSSAPTFPASSCMEHQPVFFPPLSLLHRPLVIKTANPFPFKTCSRDCQLLA